MSDTTLGENKSAKRLRNDKGNNIKVRRVSEERIKVGRIELSTVIEMEKEVIDSEIRDYTPIVHVWGTGYPMDVGGFELYVSNLGGEDIIKEYNGGLIRRIGREKINRLVNGIKEAIKPMRYEEVRALLRLSKGELYATTMLMANSAHTGVYNNKRSAQTNRIKVEV